MQPRLSERARQEPLPARVRIISWLLIAYSLIGTAWHATTFSQYDVFVGWRDYFGMAVEVGSFIAGILVLFRLPFARAIGLWVCSFGIVFQFYANATEIDAWWMLARNFWIVWFDPIFLFIFLVGVLIFARWRPRREAAPDQLLTTGDPPPL